MSEYYSTASYEVDDEDNSQEEYDPLHFMMSQNEIGDFTSSIQTILHKHTAEIRSRQSRSVLLPLTTIPKESLKGYITKQNNEIFQFLQKTDSNSSPIATAEAIFRRYGHEVTSRIPERRSILEDLKLDISANSVLQEITSNLKECGGTNIDDYIIQTNRIFMEYKKTGDGIIDLEEKLMKKTKSLDSLQKRLPLITTLKENEKLSKVLDSFKEYLDDTYKESRIEDIYNTLIEKYKKWNILREMVQLNITMTKEDTSEPTCSVCIDSPISHAMVPCGHTFCLSCTRKLHMTCYICRTPIKDRIKLYFC
jgi:uncharacterized protein YeeX (DUF496 family)